MQQFCSELFISTFINPLLLYSVISTIVFQNKMEILRTFLLLNSVFSYPVIKCNTSMKKEFT